MKKKKDIIDFFGLNKPVYYIFNGIDFNNTVEVFSPCANIIFKNCNFNLHIYINIGNEVTFENNKYKDAVSDSINKKFFSARSVNKLTFKNDNFTNSCKFKNFADPCFGIKINNANEVNFINTKVDTEYPGTIDIKAKRTKMRKSEINSPEIYIDSQSI